MLLLYNFEGIEGILGLRVHSLKIKFLHNDSSNLVTVLS